jgi:hypothetical protein
MTPSGTAKREIYTISAFSTGAKAKRRAKKEVRATPRGRKDAAALGRFQGIGNLEKRSGIQGVS